MNDHPQEAVRIFSEVLGWSTDKRAEYLDRACGDDAVMRARVETLLRAHDDAGDFMQQAPADLPYRTTAPTVIGENAGDWIGRYKMLQQIGEGGWGVVFMAEQQEPVRRLVALKVIKPGMDTKNVIARFEAERQALALMEHPHIAKVLDAGATEAGRPYFVMELVRGIKITEYCDQHSLTINERLSLFILICHAVQHAHQKGMIHRDLKPSNILVANDADGKPLPKVIDFGIAKATTGQCLTDKTVFTAFEMLIGTPAYMSPEQAAITTVDVDTRTDIYSLGVLLYELLTSTTPFDVGNLFKSGIDEVRRVILNQEPMRPSTRLSTMLGADLATVAKRHQLEGAKLIRVVRGDLDWIVGKALEKDRARRYHTANEIAEDVCRFLANEAVSARPPSNWYRFRKLAERNKVLFGATTTVAIMLVIALIMVTHSLRKERIAREDADVARAQAEVDKQHAEVEATKSRQVTRFLEEMLEGVGPSVARGRDTIMLREILEKTSERLGADLANQPSVEAELRSLIGRLYVDIGNYERAIEMHRSALTIYRRLASPLGPEVADSLSDLGAALWKERNLDEAEAAHQEALDIRRRLFGNIHPDVARSLNDLGNVYRRQRRLQEAETLTRESLQIRQELFGTEHLEVADSLRSLCIILTDQGKLIESEPIAREVLAMRRRLLGNDDPIVAAALADLAWVLGFVGKSNEAESLEEQALTIQRKTLGDEHPDVTKSIYSLGERMRQRGSLTEAHALLNAALSVQRKLLGHDHPSSLDTLRSLAWTLEGEGNSAEAEIAFREGFHLRRNSAGIQSIQALPESEGLIRMLVAQHKYQEAERILSEVMTPEFVSQSASINLLALRVDLFGRQGRWPEAVVDAAHLSKHQPTEHYWCHMLAALLVTTRDRLAYQDLCQKMFPTFAETINPYVAERIAIDCLLLPDSGTDLRLVGELADKAVTLDSGGAPMPYSQAAKALSEYRQGRFHEAIQWANRPLNHPEVHAQTYAFAVLAMSLWKLEQQDDARLMLAKGKESALIIMPGRDAEQITGAWVPWLGAQILLNEATALIHSADDAPELHLDP